MSAFIDLYRGSLRRRAYLPDSGGVSFGALRSCVRAVLHAGGVARAVEDERLLSRIRQLQLAKYEACGYRRMWKALLRSGEQVPRCRVQRLMRQAGIEGAKRRGKQWRTTRPDLHARRRPDLVKPGPPY